MSLFMEPELLTVKVDLGHGVTYFPHGHVPGVLPLSTAPAGNVLGRDAPGGVSPTFISPRDPSGAGPGHSGL